MPKTVVFCVFAVLTTVASASAACLPSDLTGSWRVYLVGSAPQPFWTRCTIAVRASGDVEPTTDCGWAVLQLTGAGNGRVREPAVTGVVGGDGALTGFVAHGAVRGAVADAGRVTATVGADGALRAEVGNAVTGEVIHPETVTGTLIDPAVSCGASGCAVANPAFTGTIANPIVKATLDDPVVRGSLASPTVTGYLDNAGVRARLVDRTVRGHLDDPAVYGGLVNPGVTVAVDRWRGVVHRGSGQLTGGRLSVTSDCVISGELVDDGARTTISHAAMEREKSSFGGVGMQSGGALFQITAIKE